MKLKEYIDSWGITSMKLNLKLLDIDFDFKDADRKAAWELYVELLTRITTQHLDCKEGDELTSLESIHKIFDITRNIIKINGRECIEFTKIAVSVLNQIIRPFTSKWHNLSLKGKFEDERECIRFRSDLRILQEELRDYTRLLAGMAEVEDLTQLEEY